MCDTANWGALDPSLPRIYNNNLNPNKPIYIIAYVLQAVTVETCKDAIEAILSFTMNVKVLLRRKKVRREHVFQYLAENQVWVKLSLKHRT